MPTEMLTEDRQRAAPSAVPKEEDDREAALLTQTRRVRRLKLSVAAWIVGTILLTTLWARNQWHANGAFERFGNEGNPGDWSPTLWALGIGLWGLIVGIMALRMHFERPATEAEVDHEVVRLRALSPNEPPGDTELRRSALAHLERLGRLRFHIAAWVLGMIVVTPLWALIEWQDNGGFERWSNNSRPGDWEPWILYVGGIWALVIAVLALRVYLERHLTHAKPVRRR